VSQSVLGKIREATRLGLVDSSLGTRFSDHQYPNIGPTHLRILRNTQACHASLIHVCMHALKKKAHPQTQTTHLRSSKSFLVMALPGSSAKKVPYRLHHTLVLLTIMSVALCSRTDIFAASSPGKTVSFELLSSVSHSARLCFLSTANIPLKRLRFNVLNVQSVLSLLRMRSPYSTRNCTQTYTVAFTALPRGICTCAFRQIRA